MWFHCYSKFGSNSFKCFLSMSSSTGVSVDVGGCITECKRRAFMLQLSTRGLLFFTFHDFNKTEFRNMIFNKLVYLFSHWFLTFHGFICKWWKFLVCKVVRLIFWCLLSFSIVCLNKSVFTNGLNYKKWLGWSRVIPCWLLTRTCRLCYATWNRRNYPEKHSYYIITAPKETSSTCAILQYALSIFPPGLFFCTGAQTL